MTVRTRLLLTILGIAALLVIPSIYALGQLRQIETIAEELQGQHAAALLAHGRLQTSVAELDRSLRSYVAAPDPELRDQVDDRLRRARVHLASLREAGYPEIADDMSRHLDPIEEGAVEIRELVESGRELQATQRLEPLKPLLVAAVDSLAIVAEAIDRRTEEDVRRARRISASAVTTVITATLITLFAAMALGLWTTGALTVPLRRLRAATATVTSGRFVVPSDLPYDRGDEIGDLSRGFRSMTRQLAELDRLRAEFLSMASHDLKTPINVVAGYAELLESGVYGELDDKQREVLRSIQEQGRELTRQVNQLLTASRLDAGGFRVDLEEVAVADLFASLQRTFSALAQQKRIDFAVDVDEGVPSRIVGDSDRLRSEVFGNLLSNAFKFTPEGGRISVRASAADGRIRIEVSDTGKGIPQAQIPYIFDKFYQVEGSDRGIGTGLGLAIAQQVVRAHNGTIEVASDPGEGTTFSVLLPVDQPRGQQRTRGFAPMEEAEPAEVGGRPARAAMDGGG